MPNKKMPIKNILTTSIVVIAIVLLAASSQQTQITPPEIVSAAVQYGQGPAPSGIAQKPTVSNLSAASITASSAVISVSIGTDREAPGTEVRFGYKKSTESAFVTFLATTVASSQTITRSLADLEANTNYDVRVTATNTAGSTVADSSFKTLAGTAAVTAPIISNIQAAAYDAGATLNFAVNPGNAETTITVRYGSNTAYASSASAIPKISTETVISKEITGLESGLNYYYLITAQNSAGLDEESGNFTTTQPAPTNQLPTLNTLAATGVTRSEATLHGSFLSKGLPTITWFEYGLTPILGSATFYQSQGGLLSGNIENKITDLKAGTTYYFRAAGLNSAGTDYGDIISFTTLSGAGPVGDFSNQALILLEECPTLKRGRSSGIYFSCNWILQTLLEALDYDIAVDGIFGKGTRKIVREFQFDQGLKADGVVGPKTKGKIISSLGIFTL